MAAVRFSCAVRGQTKSALQITLDQPRITLGRDPSCDVVLPDRSVSLRHATIDVTGPKPLLIDHNSANGTWIGNTRVAPGRAKILSTQETLSLGRFEVVVEWSMLASPSPPEETAALARELLLRMRGRLPKERRLQIMNGISKGQIEELPPVGSVVIGRADTATLTLADAEASREHAELVLEPYRAWLRDLGSKNGTEYTHRGVSVCLKQKMPPAMLFDGTELRVGNTLLVFEDEAQRWHQELRSAGDDALAAEPAAESSANALVSIPVLAAPQEGSVLAKSKSRRGKLSPVEVLLYTLTVLVLFASVAAIIWLTRGGK